MINTINDMQKIFEPYIVKAMELTGKTIYDKLKEKVEAYYSEEVFNEPNQSIPDVYQRTNALRNALFEPIINKKGNTISFSTGFEDDYYTFTYSGNPQWKRNVPATGKDVLEYFNSGLHGATVKGSHDYWDEALSELGNESGIINLFKQNCKNVGIPLIN